MKDLKGHGQDVTLKGAPERPDTIVATGMRLENEIQRLYQVTNGLMERFFPDGVDGQACDSAEPPRPENVVAKNHDEMRERIGSVCNRLDKLLNSVE